MRKGTLIAVLLLAAVLVGLPLALLSWQAARTGQPFPQFVAKTLSKALRLEPERRGGFAGTEQAGPELKVLRPTAMGQPAGGAKPWITHLAITDLDQDGLRDVVACDAKANRVCWLRQSPLGVYTEAQIGPSVQGPAHVCPVDLDGDADLDLAVAEMGMIFPNNDRIGAVVVLENQGGEGWRRRTLVDRVARVTDVRGGDLDGDGDLDLAVGQFGYDDGEIRWMENLGGWRFKSHILLSLSGTIHTPVSDMDGDGDLDIVALVSQEWEEVYIFRNDGGGRFTPQLIYGSTNEDFGSSGISLADLDQDGDQDVLYTNGDAFDYVPPGPRPWHGVQWLENLGGLEFRYHRLGDFAGAYSPQAADMDGDGDLDVVAVSGFNDWKSPRARSLVLFENRGNGSFQRRDLASSPTHLLVVDAADMDQDGRPDLVTGGMYTYPPYDRTSRVTLWLNRWGTPSDG